MLKHDKSFLDIQAVRSNEDHSRHWEPGSMTTVYLVDTETCYKDKLTKTVDYYIATKQPFQLVVLCSTIPAAEWNTLGNVITSKILAGDTGKPWIWLKKFKEGDSLVPAL